MEWRLDITRLIAGYKALGANRTWISKRLNMTLKDVDDHNVLFIRLIDKTIQKPVPDKRGYEWYEEALEELIEWEMQRSPPL